MFFISIKENQTGLGHYRSEEDILDQLGNDTVFGKRAAEVESMESLDDPDDFFGCTATESVNKNDWMIYMNDKCSNLFYLLGFL